MNFERIAKLVGEMGIIPFFPKGDEVDGIVKLIGRMCNNEAEVEWLVTRMIDVCPRWNGPVEMRAIFCARFKPKDGLEASLGTSSLAYPGVYPDLAITATPPRQLDAGDTVSVSPSVAATVGDLVRAKDMNRTLARVVVREIPVIKLTAENRITEETVRNAVKELRDGKAREEAGIIP